MENATKEHIAGAVGRGAAWTVFTTLAMKGITFVYILIVLNYLTVFQYGVAELVLTSVPLLSLLLLPGLNATVIADMGRERAAGNISRMKGLLVSYLKVQVLFAVVAWAVVFFGAQALAVLYGKGSTVLFFQIVSFSFLISPLRSTVQTVQSVFWAFRQQSFYSFIEEGWKLTLVIVFVLALKLGITGLLLAVVMCQMLALITIVYPLISLDRTFWASRAEYFPTFYFLYHHGKWGVFANYFGTFGKNIRPWIINIFLGPTAVGLFAIVQGLIGHVVSLVPLDSIMRSVLPQYVHTKDRFNILIAKAVKYELLGYIVAGSGSALAMPFLIHWFFPQYTAAIILFQVMLVMLSSTAFDVIFAGAFIALRAQRNLFWASLYKVILAVVLMPPLLYLFGILGIAYANIAVNTLYVWERYLTLKRLLPGFSLSFRSFVRIDENDKLVLQWSVRFFMNMPIVRSVFRRVDSVGLK